MSIYHQGVILRSSERGHGSTSTDHHSMKWILLLGTTKPPPADSPECLACSPWRQPARRESRSWKLGTVCDASVPGWCDIRAAVSGAGIRMMLQLPTSKRHLGGLHSQLSIPYVDLHSSNTIVRRCCNKARLPNGGSVSRSYLYFGW